MNQSLKRSFLCVSALAAITTTTPAHAEQRVLRGSYILQTISPGARVPRSTLTVTSLSRQQGLHIATVASEGSQASVPYRRGANMCAHLLKPTFMKRHAARLRLKPSKFQRTVIGCDPNWSVSLIMTPNDMSKFWPGMWGLEQIHAPAAWDITTGSSAVVVGVVDTGIDRNHPDLAANMWTNADDIAGNGIDDDGNGYTDDTYGFGITHESSSPDPMDNHNHGTHCAGTIGAIGNNNRGVPGINWNVKIMALKAFASNGTGYLSDVLTVLNYALTMKSRGVNLRVLSNSYGGFPYSATFESTLATIEGAGILFVAGAGNNNSDNESSPFYPASYTTTGVLSVAATDQQDLRATFSNYGATSVDIGAPGVNIWSTIRTSSNGGYGLFSGTSMATPHASGVAALIAGRYPSLTVAQLKMAILNSVDPLQSLQGKTVTGGRLNATAALLMAASLVATPTPTATPSPTPTLIPAPTSSSTPIPTPTTSSPPTPGPSQKPTLAFTSQIVGGAFTSTLGTTPWGTTTVALRGEGGELVTILSVHKGTGQFRKTVKLKFGSTYAIVPIIPASYAVVGAASCSLIANGTEQPCSVTVQPDGKTISGRITEKQRRSAVAAAGASVTIHHVPSGRVVAEAVTAADGSYTATEVPYGERITVTASTVSGHTVRSPAIRILSDTSRSLYAK